MFLSVYGNIIGWMEQHQLPCFFKAIFHFDCPGCGLQRSLLALLKGQFRVSISLYPALLPILLLFAYSVFYLVYRNKNGARNIRFLFSLAALIIFIQYIYKILNLVN